jgi:hypothetical protein
MDDAAFHSTARAAKNAKHVPSFLSLVSGPDCRLIAKRTAKLTASLWRSVRSMDSSFAVVI